jgi:hypothetical protein
MSSEFDNLAEIEKAAVEAALNRCRALAAQIESELHKKRPAHFVDKLSLADFYASLEHAADVIGQKGQTVSREDTCCCAAGFADAAPSVVIEGELRLLTLSWAWCGLLESRGGKLKIK